MSLETLVGKIWTLNSSLDGSEPLLWPALIGPTGSGKTTRLSRLAKDLTITIKKILLGTMNPEDFGGIPRVLEHERRMQWFLDWVDEDLVSEPFVLFLDELDKAHPSHWASVLTVMTSREIRHYRMPNIRICCALQPVDPGDFLSDETGCALAARLIFLPVAYDADYLGRKHRRPPASFLRQQDIALPLLPEPSSRQMDWLATAWDSGLFTDEEIDTLLRGTISAAYRPTVREWLESEHSHHVTVEQLFDVVREDVSRVENLDVPTLSLLFTECCTKVGWTPELYKAILFRIWDEQEPAAIRGIYQAAVEVMKDAARQQPLGTDNPGWFHLFHPLSADEVKAIHDELGTELFENWIPLPAK